MKKILSIFGIITLGLLNFGYCADVINPGDSFSINSPATFSAGANLIVCAEGGGGYFDYMGNSTNFNGFPTVCIVVSNGDTFNISVWGNTTINSYYVNCPSSSCSQCEDDLYICQNSLYTSEGNLASCQSSLSTATGNLASCQSSLSTATGNLATCESDLYNCQNSSSCDYSGYILESSVDTQYCMINGLCPSSTGDIVVEGSGFSSVYIYSDNRYFPITGTNNIYVNLPSYLGFNYDYSNGGDDLDIDLGYVVDSGYISDIKDIQGSIPNEVDFNNIVKYLLPLFVPGLCVILLLYFIFRFVKKIF